MYERFTDRARKVMQLANQEAQRFNHEYIGTEHVLLGLVKEGSGVASHVLSGMGVDIRNVRIEVEKLVQSGPQQITMGKLPHTPQVRAVLAHAVDEDRHINRNYIGTEHLLLGLLREQNGVAATVLNILGVTLDAVRKAVLELFRHGQTEAAVSGSDGHSFDVRRIFAFSIGACGDDEKINWIPVQSDKPDGWPRTKDGHLVKPGMTVWHHNSLGTILAIYQDNDPHRGGVWIDLVDAFGNNDGCTSISDCYVVKPEEPVTAESVLKGLYDVLTNKQVQAPVIGQPMMDREQKLRSLIRAAEKVLGIQNGSES